MTYKQSTGEMFAADGTLLGTGHAGNGAGRNNPTMQWTHNVGPLPVGRYTVGLFATHAQLGPWSAPLIPVPAPAPNTPYSWLGGRGGFYIHGPEFSEGCIVLPITVRQQIAGGTDRDLEVIS